MVSKSILEMKGRLLIYVLILTYLASLTISTGGFQPILLPSTTSTTPLNPYPYGIYNFYTDLLEDYNVGFVSTPLDISLEGGKLLYLVIGPDNPFSNSEAEHIARLLEAGRIDLFVADETNISNSILSILGLEIDGRILSRYGVGDETRYIAEVDCSLIGEGFISKSSFIKEFPDGSEILCTSPNEFVVERELIKFPPIGVRISLDSGSEILVLADSSVCTNFMYSSSWWNEEGNKGLCNGLLRLLTEDGYRTILFDIGHYSGSQLLTPLIADYIIKSIIIFQVIIGFILDIMGPLLFPFILFISLLVIRTFVDIFKIEFKEVQDPTLDTIVYRVLKYYSGRFNPLQRSLGLRFKVIRRFLIDKFLRDFK